MIATVAALGPVRALFLAAAALAALAAGGPVMAYESNYPATEPGEVELKQLPPARVLEAEGGSDGSRNGAFMTLFRYIERNEVAMTVPVEADTAPMRMRFFVGSDHQGPLPSEESGVRLFDRPEQTVVSAGLRGSYSIETFERGLALARAFLAEHPEWEQAGAPYAVYWNGPFVPWFMKRSEVHVPVRRVSTDG